MGTALRRRVHSTARRRAGSARWAAGTVPAPSGQVGKQKKTLKPGQRVRWNTAQGATTGRVKKRVTGETRIAGHVAKASEDEPQYVVESERSGKRAVHRPQALRRAKA